MTVAAPGQDGASSFPKNPAGLVNLRPGAFVYKMSATETPSSDEKSWHPADEAEGMMARGHATPCGKQTPATAQADWLRSTLAVYPLRQ